MMVMAGFSENPACWARWWSPSPPSSRPAAAISMSAVGQGPRGRSLGADLRVFFAIANRALAPCVPTAPSRWIPQDSEAKAADCDTEIWRPGSRPQPACLLAGHPSGSTGHDCAANRSGPVAARDRHRLPRMDVFSRTYLAAPVKLRGSPIRQVASAASAQTKAPVVIAARMPQRSARRPPAAEATAQTARWAIW